MQLYTYSVLFPGWPTLRGLILIPFLIQHLASMSSSRLFVFASSEAALNVTVYFPDSKLCPQCYLEMADVSVQPPLLYSLVHTSLNTWSNPSMPSAAPAGCLTVLLRTKSTSLSYPCPSSSLWASSTTPSCSSIGACTPYSNNSSRSSHYSPSPAALPPSHLSSIININIFPAFIPNPWLKNTTFLVSVPGSTLPSRKVAVFTPEAMDENALSRDVSLVYLLGIDELWIGSFVAQIGPALFTGLLPPNTIFLFVPTSTYELTFEPCLYNCEALGGSNGGSIYAPNKTASYGGATSLGQYLLELVPQVQAQTGMRIQTKALAGKMLILIIEDR